MKRFNWLYSYRVALGRSLRKRHDRREQLEARKRRLSFEALECRCLLAADFGDAPDAAIGRRMEIINPCH